MYILVHVMQLPFIMKFTIRIAHCINSAVQIRQLITWGSKGAFRWEKCVPISLKIFTIYVTLPYI